MDSARQSKYCDSHRPEKPCLPTDQSPRHQDSYRCRLIIISMLKRQTHGMYRTGQGFSQCRLDKRQIIRKDRQILRLDGHFFSKCTRHRMPINSRFAHKCSLPDTQDTHATCHQWVNGHALSLQWPIIRHATASCPKTNGGTRRSSWPCQACISDPQIRKTPNQQQPVPITNRGWQSRISDNCVPV